MEKQCNNSARLPQKAKSMVLELVFILFAASEKLKKKPVDILAAFDANSDFQLFKKHYVYY